MIEPVPNTDLYRTTVPLEVGGITIPVGTATDGASIPSFLWSTLLTPFHPRVILAALYHDYSYRTGGSRKIVDIGFYNLLREAGVPRMKAALMYRGVRVFGSGAFRRLRK